MLGGLERGLGVLTGAGGGGIISFDRPRSPPLAASRRCANSARILMSLSLGPAETALCSAEAALGPLYPRLGKDVPRSPFPPPGRSMLRVPAWLSEKASAGIGTRTKSLSSRNASAASTEVSRLAVANIATDPGELLEALESYPSGPQLLSQSDSSYS